MAYKVQKKCKVCGNLYTPCGDCEKDGTAFHWRTVACSYECGQEYLKRVMAAREKVEISKQPIIKEKKSSSVEESMKDVKKITPKYRGKNKRESEQID